MSSSIREEDSKEVSESSKSSDVISCADAPKS